MTVTIEDQQIKLSRSAQNALRELRKIKVQQDELKERAKVLQARIEPELAASLSLGGKIVALIGGVPVASLKSTIRRNVNMALLRKRAPEVVEECTVESEVRTFALLGE